MAFAAPYVRAAIDGGIRAAMYGALAGSIAGVARTAMGGARDAERLRREEALDKADALTLDPNVLEAVLSLGVLRSRAPEAYAEVVEGCDSLVDLWSQVAPGDDARAMHPRMAASHVALARGGLDELERVVRSSPEDGGLAADFDEMRATLEKLLSNYQHNISLTTMLHLPQRPE